MVLFSFLWNPFLVLINAYESESCLSEVFYGYCDIECRTLKGVEGRLRNNQFVAESISIPISVF